MDYIIGNPKNVEFIIDSKLGNEKFYLPKALDDNMINKMVNRYINTKEVNYNYLEKISTFNSSNGIKITTSNKVMASKKKREFSDQCINNDNKTFDFFIGIGGIENAYQNINKNNKDGIVFNREYLKNTLEFQSILNNYKSLFYFVDQWGILTPKLDYGLKKTQMEEFVITSNRGSFPFSHSFVTLEAIQNLKNKLYYSFLKDNNINIETVFSWYFSDYLTKKHEADKFIFHVSTANSYREKCMNIISNIESILEQFNSFVNDNDIDYEVLENSSDDTSFEKISSLIDQKYVNTNKESLEIFKYIFNEFDGINQDLDIDESETNFWELFSNCGQIKFYIKRKSSNLKKLIELNILSEVNKKEIVVNEEKLLFIYQLYMNTVLVYPSLSENEKRIINELNEKKLVTFSSSLFCDLEADLLMYYLNNKKFDNGYKLRNKYMHGRMNHLSEEDHYSNYLILVKIFIWIILKINDEFELANTLKNK